MNSKNFCDRETVLHNHLRAISVASIRDALHVDDSAVSRIKSGERRLSFAEFCQLVALPSTANPQGLALAPARSMIITPSCFHALLSLSRDALNMMTETEGAA
ncbi:hypothetical protein [uncultured Cardiobacterium sp.]|uniref:hypothetical protein n=1 Tax=uncultured Cardiobacterium sp. TaxID=417619 RepID=UPI002626D0BE|nr:hypothetical protein [uncultured Cardiobacterium sp.]